MSNNLHRHLEHKPSLLEIPCLPNNACKKENDSILKVHEIECVARAEAQLFTEPDNVNISVLPPIAVKADGNWNKRSYKTQYNSYTGTSEKIKSTTELVDYYGIFAINLKLFKLCRLYNIFDPNEKKMFRWNIYRLFLFFWTVFVNCYFLFGIFGFIIEMEDTISQIELILLLIIYYAIYMNIFIIILFLYKAETIWNVFEVARFDFLFSVSCQKNVDILQKCCNKTKKITNVYFFAIVLVIIQWILSPMILEKFILNYNTNHRIINIINVRIPLTIQTYNEYYVVFYLIEIIITIYWSYCLLVYGVFLLSFSWVIISQYDILYTTYKNIAYENRSQSFTDRDIKYSNDYDIINSVIADQQRLNLKVQLYFSVIRPIILFLVPSIATLITCNVMGLVFVYTSMKLYSVIYMTKIVSAIILFCFELYVICYLFGAIKNKKDLINFGIYSSNWTNMDLKTKKLMLQTMQMNSANKLVLRLTPNKIIDLQMFLNVMTTCYNIISVLLKLIYTKKQNLE